MKIPYVENDVSDIVDMVIYPEEILDSLIKRGIVESPKYNYYEDCGDMCNIMTFIIGNKILKEISEDAEITVKEGVFGMLGNHTWLEIENTIIDSTLKQFVYDAKELCFIDNKFSEYQAVKSYTFDDWVEQSPNFL